MPSQSARSAALARAVDRPRKRMGKSVCALMYRMRDTITSKIGPLHHKMTVATVNKQPQSTDKQASVLCSGSDAWL